MILVVLAALTLPGTAAATRPGLPIGAASLPETRTTEVLAPGVRYIKVVRGTLSKHDGWTADVAVVGDQHLEAVVGHSRRDQSSSLVVVQRRRTAVFIPLNTIEPIGALCVTVSYQMIGAWNFTQILRLRPSTRGRSGRSPWRRNGMSGPRCVS